MPGYLGALTMLLLVGMVLTRAFLLRRQGVQAMHFADLDKTDFIIPPFALFYFYMIFAGAFNLPWPARQTLFQSTLAAWSGVVLCLAGLALMLWALVSFGRSFRVGIDTRHPGGLVTEGVFAHSRNPIYVAFAFVLLGQFLIFPHWVLLLYLLAGVWLLNRQVLREEAFLKAHYGRKFDLYCERVRRYL